MTEIKRLPGTARMSNAAIHNGTVYTKGITARGGPSDIAGQTRNVLDQLDALLAEAGTTRSNVLQMMIWLTDMSDFGAMNEVYDAWVVAGAEPVRACVGAPLASPELLIEIRAVAAL
ncbi:RidA family protein [Devosia sp. A449]